MKPLSVALFFTTALIFILISQAESQGRCRPGQRWMQECNTCFCNSNGFPACTKIGCYGPVVQIKKRSVDVDSQNESQGRCRPGQRWMQECNTCFCKSNGFPACTKIGCHGPVVQIKKRSVDDDSQIGCKPGASWMESCNLCHCNASGRPVCTKKLCGDEAGSLIKTKREVQIPKPDCEPGTIWKKNCNTCVCDAGGFSACTDRACP